MTCTINLAIGIDFKLSLVQNEELVRRVDFAFHVTFHWIASKLLVGRNFLSGKLYIYYFCHKLPRTLPRYRSQCPRVLGPLNECKDQWPHISPPQRQSKWLKLNRTTAIWMLNLIWIQNPQKSGAQIQSKRQKYHISISKQIVKFMSGIDWFEWN